MGSARRFPAIKPASIITTIAVDFILTIPKRPHMITFPVTYSIASAIRSPHRGQSGRASGVLELFVNDLSELLVWNTSADEASVKQETRRAADSELQPFLEIRFNGGGAGAGIEAFVKVAGIQTDCLRRRLKLRN